MIRRANPGDAPALESLAFRSKAHWGYDAAFMELARPALAVPPEYIENSYVFLAENRQGEAIAFFGFKDIAGEIFLNDFFVAPELIGHGLGAALWQHALQVAREHGYRFFLIESDPFARDFYLHMGARLIGEMESSATGRLLPLLRYNVEEI